MCANGNAGFNLKSALCCVALLFTAIHCDEINLSCSDILKRNKTNINRYFRFGSNYIATMEHAEAHVVYHQVYKTKWVFEILDEDPEHSLRRCVGLSSILRYAHTFQRDSVLQNPSETELFFNSSMAVGIIEADEEVWRKGGSCQISILEDILELGAIRPDWPFVEDVWNFSSPFFGVHLGWLQGFRYVEEQRVPLPLTDLTVLQNTSIEWIHITNFRNAPVISHMPLLRSITIEDCRLIQFDVDSFIGTPEVENTTIRHSSIRVMPINIGELTNLKSLEISHSTYPRESFSLQSHRLSNLQKLQTLDFSNTRLYQRLEQLPLLQGLKNLLLSQCQIQEIDESSFTGLPALEVLDLSGNLIHTLPPLVFSNQRYLQILDLSKNKLTNWPVLHNNSLQLLDLSGNSLQYLLNLGAYGTTTEYLNISKNEIVSWNDSNIFSINLPVSENTEDIPAIEGISVKTVNLSNNRMIGFSSTMLESVKDVTEMDLGGNQFDCDHCGMIFFQMWLNTSSTNLTNLGTSNPLLCSSPSVVENSHLVTVQLDRKLCSKNDTETWPFLFLHIGIVILLLLILSVLVCKFWSPFIYILHLYKIRRTTRNFTDVHDKYTFDAFICYSSHDRQFAFNKLARTLQKDPANYELCLHERDFPLASHIVSKIGSFIQRSRKTVAVLSEDFIQTQWCKWEMEMAQHKIFQDDKQFLIFILLDNLLRCELPQSLQTLLSSRITLKWPSSGGEDEEKAIQQLKDALGPTDFQQTNQSPPNLSVVTSDH